MRFLIGVVLIIIGGVLTAVTGFVPLSILIFVGVFLFASFPTQNVFPEYVIANTDRVLMRKRHYIIFLPFYIISVILTLGKSVLLIPYKEEYFIAVLRDGEQADLTPVSRKEYKELLNFQRNVYSSQVLSKTFMETAYTLEGIGLQQKKRRLVLASVFAALMLTTAFVPGGIAVTLIYEAVFLPMVLLWIPAYKDAKILHNAYLRATNAKQEGI